MMNFEEFQNAVTKGFSVLAETKTKDKLIIAVYPVQKINQTLTGFAAKKETDSISPVIYLDDYYEQYKAGTSIDTIISDIYKNWLEALTNPFLAETVDFLDSSAQGKLDTPTLSVNTCYNFIHRFSDFDSMKDKIIVNVINAERNKVLLESVPHKMIADLAIVYRVLVSELEDGDASVIIRNEHLQVWNATVDSIHELAVENTKRLRPVEISTMAEYIAQYMNMPVELIGLTLPLMYVVSNDKKLQGAATILFEDVLLELSEKLESDLYILPSSIHELIVVSTKDYTPERLINMVKSVNETAVAPEDFLSDNVYRFETETKTLSIA